MNVTISPAPWSTVAALPDYLLLAQTRQLARHEQALQVLVLDHLREIQARDLHLTRGYGSLFDYVVRELDYTAAAAWRRIKAMRLCSDTNGARELLQRGKLNVSNAAQLQNLFERSDRRHGRSPGRGGAGGGPGGEPRDGIAPGEPALADPMRGGGRVTGAGPVPEAGPVLDAAARERLVRQAAGKSTREVQQMLAEVDPDLARPSDRMRALGGGRWELKAAVGAECRHGIEKLQMLLSHRDPHLTLGGLVERLVRDGLERYDPARPPRPRRTPRNGGRVAGAAAGSASTRARSETAAVQPSVVGAKGAELERRSEAEREDAPPAAKGVGVARPSAPRRDTVVVPGIAQSAANGVGAAQPSAPKRDTVAGPGNTKSAAQPDGVALPSAPKRDTAAGPGNTKSAAQPDGVAQPSAPKRDTVAGPGNTKPAAQRGGVARPSAPKRDTAAGPGNTKSAAQQGGVAQPSARKRFAEADDGGAKPAPVQGVVRRSGTEPKRPPALERHFALLSRFGALPGSRSRYVPVAVKREVWRRDQGCCNFVDQHSGRRCGSRYRLEIDHIVPFALGGATETSNLRLRCGVHHKLRHAQRDAQSASWPTEARRVPVCAADPVSSGRTVGSVT